MRSADWRVLDMPESRTMTWPSRLIGRQSNCPEWLVSRSSGSIEESVGHFLGAYTKRITPSVARSTRSIAERETLPGGIKPRTPHHRSSGGPTRRKRRHSTIFLDRTRKGHRQSDEQWTCFKGNVEKTSERHGGALMGSYERIDRYHFRLNRTDFNCK